MIKLILCCPVIAAFLFVASASNLQKIAFSRGGVFLNLQSSQADPQENKMISVPFNQSIERTAIAVDFGAKYEEENEIDSPTSMLVVISTNETALTTSSSSSFHQYNCFPPYMSRK